VLIATGGFQGDRELVRRLVGEGAEEMPLRANPSSTGDGLRMGLTAGAALSAGLDGFYGHLLPSPLRRFRLEDHIPLAQYHSRAGLLVNRFGRRFVDETLGDDRSNQATLRQRGGRAVLICDERTRTEHAVTAPHPHGLAVDRLARAREAGARIASTESLDALVDAVAGWGVNGPRLRATIERANVGDGPGLREPPYHALEVQSSITFTFGGLRADAGGRVLRADGRPVPRLYVAGADLGGLQEEAYVGGLSLGLVFGPHVAEAALVERSRA
jgi:succinate dehydrogenase/fumarate reductase flavoprotein subunit